MNNTDDMALNQDAGEDTSVSTTPVEETKMPAEDLTPVSDAIPTGAVEVKGEESKEEVPAKKGAEARIRELNARAKEAEEKAETATEKAQSLAEQLESFTKGNIPQVPQAPYQSQVAPGAEISPEEYQADVTRTADALVQLRFNQYKIIENINSEAGRAIKEHPELDPDSEQFDKELNDSVTEATLAYVRSNPTGSVRKFVDKLMKPYKRSLTKEVAKEAEAITKQVSQTALRPTPSTKGEKSLKDKTIKELEDELGFVY